jgi:predicted MFS family arabinose efflux permease
VAFLGSALRWSLLSTMTSSWAILLQAPLHAFTFGLYWVSATTLIREYAGPRASAAGQGLLTAAVGIGSIIANLTGGSLLERGGGFLLFRCAAGLALLAALLAVLHAVARRHAALA